MIPCPVKGCRQRCRTPDTLFVHLAQEHQKNDVVAALVREVHHYGPGSRLLTRERAMRTVRAMYRKDLIDFGLYKRLEEQLDPPEQKPRGAPHE